MGRPRKDTEVAGAEGPTEAPKAQSKALDGELELRLASIKKKFGDGAIMTLGSHIESNPVQYISSGSLALDIVLGKGGFPFGRIIEIYGPEGSGKTTLLIELIIASQKMGLKCAFIDMENNFNPEYGVQLGMDKNKLFFAQPSDGNEALEICRDLIPTMDIVVVDSLAALAPVAEMQKEMTENPQMGLLPAMLSRFFRDNEQSINKSKCLFVCTNQIREKVGVMFGNPETTPGGRAMKFAASQRLEIRPVEKITSGTGEIIGHKVKVKVVKNKMAAPYQECNFNIIFGKGIDKVADLLEVGVQLSVIEKSGSWYAYGDKRLGQGVSGVRTELEANPDLANEIRNKIRGIFGAQWGKEGKG